MVIGVKNLVDIKELIRKNLPYFFGIIIIAILCIYVLIFKPRATYVLAPRVLDPIYGFLRPKSLIDFQNDLKIKSNSQINNIEN